MSGTPKTCGDCAHLREVVTLWCSNKDAVKARGTAIPGVVNCPFWEEERHVRRA